MVTSLKNLDLTLPIIIDENLQMINVPKIIQNIDYFSKKRITKTPYTLNISLFTILVMALITFGIIIFSTLTFGKSSAYTNLV